VTPEDLLDATPGDKPSPRFKDVYQTPPSEVLERGQTFFNQIYGKISRRVMGQMDRSGAEDLGLVARLTYGYVLSNTDVLTPAETSFVLIASLIPQDVSEKLLIRLPLASLGPDADWSTLGQPSAQGSLAGSAQRRSQCRGNKGSQRCGDKDLRGIWYEKAQ
jgi:hypothetical protein